MKLKDFLDNPSEIFVGAMLQFPLYFILGWWVIPVQLLCGVLWRLGGTSEASKLFRRLGVPFVVCFSTFLTLHQLGIFLAIPFMIWISPFAYGKDSWVYKFFMGTTDSYLKADFLTRITTFGWYWLMFFLALLLKF